jgi:hypothetical protein
VQYAIRVLQNTRVLPSQIPIRETRIAAIRARTLQYAFRVLCNTRVLPIRACIALPIGNTRFVYCAIRVSRIAEYGLPIFNKLYRNGHEKISETY